MNNTKLEVPEELKKAIAERLSQNIEPKADAAIDKIIELAGGDSGKLGKIQRMICHLVLQTLCGAFAGEIVRGSREYTEYMKAEEKEGVNTLSKGEVDALLRQHEDK